MTSHIRALDEADCALVPTWRRRIGALTPRRPLGALLLAAALSATAVLPAVAAVEDEDPEDPVQELEQTQEELEQAEAKMGELLRRIDAVEAEVAAADARLAELQGQLAIVERDLGAAEAAAEEATEDVADAQRALRAAAQRQAEAEDAWAEARTALEARVAATWMHGSTDASDVLFGGLLQADDLHDVAVVRQASRRLLNHDRVLLETAVDASIAATEARGDAEVQQRPLQGSVVEGVEGLRRAAEVPAGHEDLRDRRHPGDLAQRRA